MRKCNEKEEAFCREILADPAFNAEAAAARAGYKDGNGFRAHSGSRLMERECVQNRIAELIAARNERLDVDADKAVRELLMLAHSDIGDVLDFSGKQPVMRDAHTIPERARRAISSVKVKRTVEGSGEDKKEVEIIEFKFWDKVSALDKLLKHLGIDRNGSAKKKEAPEDLQQSFRDIFKDGNVRVRVREIAYERVADDEEKRLEIPADSECAGRVGPIPISGIPPVSGEAPSGERVPPDAPHEAD